MATFPEIDDVLRGRVQLQAVCEQAHESFHKEAQASWVAYQKTGRHLTGQEVQTWLSTWGTPDESAVPECHD